MVPRWVIWISPTKESPVVADLFFAENVAIKRLSENINCLFTRQDVGISGLGKDALKRYAALVKFARRDTGSVGKLLGEVEVRTREIPNGNSQGCPAIIRGRLTIVFDVENCFGTHIGRNIGNAGFRYLYICAQFSLGVFLAGAPHFDCEEGQNSGEKRDHDSATKIDDGFVFLEPGEE